MPFLALCLAVCGLFSCRVGPAEGPEREAAGNEAAPAKAADLVKLLGDEQYTVRQRVAEELKALGRAAIRPLTEALASPDAEVRSRVASLLVDLRGRGFIGIGLREEWPENDREFFPRAAPPETDDPTPPAGADQRFPPPLVLVQQVLAGYPAEKAGLQNGDRILAINGLPMEGNFDVTREVGLVGPGCEVSLLIEREGKKQLVVLTTARHPQDDDVPVDLRPPPENRPGEAASPADGKERPPF